MLIAGYVSKFKKGWVTFVSNFTDNQYDFFVDTGDTIKKNDAVRLYVSGRSIKHIWINGKKYK